MTALLALALSAPFLQAGVGPASFQRVIDGRRTHLVLGLRAGADLGPHLGAELGALFAGESAGPRAVRVQTEWRMCDARIAGRLPLAWGLEAGAAAGALLDLGYTRLTVADGEPALSDHLHLTPGASAGVFLRWRKGRFEARIDLGGWAHAGRIDLWNTIALGLVLE